VSRSLSNAEKYTPKHAHRRAPSAPKKVLRNTLLLTSVAAAATGVAVSGGVLASSGAGLTAAAAQLPGRSDVPTLTAADLAARSEGEASRSDRRDATDPTKAGSLSAASGSAVTVTHDVTQGDPREIARALLTEFGFGSEQMDCLDPLWEGESGWRVDANNPYSSAYGIPQALPGSKMSSVGDDWATNPVTQIRWGLGYISERYGSPCSAWGFKQSHGWY
jgi:hypothetical protein